MDSFEKVLARALGRREAPEGFAAGVLERTDGRNAAGGRRRNRWLAAAAALMLLVGGVAFERAYRRQVEGQRASEQVLLALEVTGSTLRAIRERVSATTVAVRPLPAEPAPEQPETQDPDSN